MAGKILIDNEKSSRNIFVVDDDPGLLELLSLNLTSMHYNPEGFLSGDVALKKIKQSPPDLLLLDYKVGNMTAKDFLARMKREDLDVPFIVMTGFGDEKIAVEMMKLGARDYIIKDSNFLEIYPLVVQKVINEISLEESLKQSEVNIKEMERKLMLMFQSTSDAIFFTDTKGKITEINDSSIDVHGYSNKDELIGKDLFEFVLPEEMPSVLEDMQKFLKKGKIGPLEYKSRKKNGDAIDAEVNAYMIKDINNNPEGYIVVTRDISYRKKIERQIFEEKNKAQTYLNLSGVIFVILNPEGRVDLINKKGCEVLGYREKNIIGKSWFDNFIPKRIKSNIKKVFKDVISGKEKYSDYFENPIITKSGDERIIAWYNTVFTDKDGNIIQTLSQGVDITDKKKAEEATNRAFSDLEQIFNSAKTGMIIVDKDFNLLRTNKSFLDLFGLTKRQVASKKCYDLMKYDSCSTDNCCMKKILGGEQNYNREIEKKSKRNKKIVRYIESVTPFYEGDKIVGIIKSFTDVSEIRELEKETLTSVEKERARIGEDLHDELGQELTTLGFLVEALKQKYEVRQKIKTSDFDEIKFLITNSIDHTKRIAQGLMPFRLEGTSLSEAIREFAKKIEKTFGVSCLVKIIGNLRLKDNVVVSNLYYITKESINNALKHGKPRQIVISLLKNKNSFELIIENDVSEPQKIKKRETGMGLKIMKHRAKIINAELDAGLSGENFVVSVKLKAI
jgi:PAS domain S-box-containing protein